MTRKRDIIAEITDKRRRLGRRTKRATDAVGRALDILTLINGTKALSDFSVDARREIAQHVPVSLVSLLEGYTRLVIRDLIDHGSPFRENAASLEGLRTDASVVLRMQAARVSAGDLVAHLVPISSFDDVVRHLSTVLDVDFFGELRKQPAGPKGSYELAEPDARDTLIQVFADRHIVCHEFMPKVRRSRAAQQKQRAADIRFIIVADGYVQPFLAS